MSYVTDKFDDEVIRLLQSGAVGFMPSDTIYGLSAIALDEKAVEKLHNLKDRDEHKPFIVLISNFRMLNLLSIEEKEVEGLKKYWPGALTAICHTSAAPAWLQLGTSSLAVRIPDDEKLRLLIDEIGPMISTSANRQGEPPVNSTSEARKIFGEKLSFYVDVGEVKGVASTIVKQTGAGLEVIRQGAVKIETKETRE